jgi:sortase A
MRRRLFRPIAGVLLAAALLALGYVGFVLVAARVYQASEHRRLGRETAAATGVTLTAIEGTAIGEIHISRLGVSAVIVQGDSSDILQRAVGHLMETALPGEAGNVVLAAHRDTFFRPLKGIRVGDLIVLVTPARDFEYVVISTAVVSPDAVEVLDPTPARTLTLVTCFPFSYLGAAPDRFVVRARQIIGGSGVARRAQPL